MIIKFIIIMTKKIKLFLNSEFYDEMLYQYEEKDADLRKLIFSLLSPLGKQGKMTKLHQIIQARTPKDINGKPEVVEKKLSEVNLDKTKVESDSTWVPKNIKDIREYLLSISERLYEDLVFYGKVYCARLTIYNEYLEKGVKKAELPTCFEQIIQDNVVGLLINSVGNNIEAEYLEEHEELEKKLANKIPKRKK